MEGAAPIEIPIKLTPLQIRNIFRRAALRLGMPTEGKTDAEIVRAVMVAWMRRLADLSRDQQREDALNEYRHTLEQTLTGDNDIVDATQA